MQRRNLTTHEIETLKPIWEAISRLWLDTELDSGDLLEIARILKKSGLSSHDLQQIYLFDVAPAVFMNLYVTAGAWNGFDQNWLADKIIKRKNSKWNMIHVLLQFPITRRFFTGGTEINWKEVLKNLNKGASLH